MPEIRGSLRASCEDGSWITTAYLVAESNTFLIAGLAMLACVADAFALRGASEGST